MPPRQTQPGAVRVAGFDGENQNDGTFSVTTVENSPGNADSEDLISAQLVGDIPQAEIVEEKHCTKRVKIWSGVAVVLLVTLAVVLGTVLPPQIKANSSKTRADPPTPSPQEVIQELESLLIPVSFDNGTAIRTASSPQNKALIWLSNNTYINSYLNATKVQRYALATLFYYTNGNRLFSEADWMSNRDECDWTSVFCDENRSLEKLWFSYINFFGTIPNELATIPNELALLSNLSKSTVVCLLVVIIVVTCFFIVLSCLLVIFHSTADLYLNGINLTGTIPSQLGLLRKLSKSSIV
jgi:hypothetical protein